MLRGAPRDMRVFYELIIFLLVGVQSRQKVHAQIGDEDADEADDGHYGHGSFPPAPDVAQVEHDGVNEPGYE